MTITKASVDAELVARCRGLLAFVGLSTATDGTNPDTAGAIMEGLGTLGLIVAAYRVSDTPDLSVVAITDLPQLLDVAEYRLLMSILGSLTKVDQSIGMGSQSLGQVRRDLLQTLKSLNDTLRVQYGYGLGKLFGGSIDLGFATTDPCRTEPLWTCGGNGTASGDLTDQTGG